MRWSAFGTAMAVVCAGPALSRGQFVEVASESRDNVGIGGIDADISEAGAVAFIGGSEGDRIYIGAEDAPEGLLVSLDLSGFGLTQASAVELEADWVVFSAQSLADGRRRGVYAVPQQGGALRALFEGCAEICDPGGAPGPSPFYARSLQVSVNGTVAFSTVREGEGAVYRGFVDGAVTPVQRGSRAGGYLYNTIGVAVNDLGQVAVHAEYFAPPASLLRRGIFVFDAPHEPISDVATIVHGLSVAMQPQPSFLDEGHVAYGYTHGLYRAAPTPYADRAGELPAALQVLADTQGGFAEFRRYSRDERFTLVSSEAGPYAFEAFLDDGRHGVFRGPDAARDAVLREGDALFGGIVREVYLEGINGRGQIVMRVLLERAGGLDKLIVRVDADSAMRPDEPPRKPWWLEVLEKLLKRFKPHGWL